MDSRLKTKLYNSKLLNRGELAAYLDALLRLPLSTIEHFRHGSTVSGLHPFNHHAGQTFGDGARSIIGIGRGKGIMLAR